MTRPEEKNYKQGDKFAVFSYCNALNNYIDYLLRGREEYKKDLDEHIKVLDNMLHKMRYSEIIKHIQ